MKPALHRRRPSPDIGDRIFAFLIRLYPNQFREQFGALILDCFRQRRQAAAGRLARIDLWRREVLDLIESAIVVRRQENRSHFPAWRRLRQGIRQDWKWAWRGIARRPLSSLTAAAIVALGIGANAAIFSFIHAVLLTPLPFPQADRIVTLWEDFSARGGPSMEWVEAPNLAEWRRSRSLSKLAAFRQEQMAYATPQGSRLATALEVQDEFFEVVGVGPKWGRKLVQADQTPQAAPVAVVSHEFWRRTRPLTASFAEYSIHFQDLHLRVVGVMPAGFRLPLMGPFDLWTPLRLDERTMPRGLFELKALGRLADGVTAEEAQAELSRIMRAVGRRHPSNQDTAVTVVPLKELVERPVRAPFLMLQALTLLVLLIGCSNIAGLLLDRNLDRDREIAIRRAVGAGRGRIVRQFLAEAMILWSIGGLAGLFLAHLLIGLLLQIAPPEISSFATISLNAEIVLVAVTAALLTGLIFGSISAIKGLPSRSMSLRLASTSHPLRSRTLLATVQVSAALPLLVCTGLLVKSLTGLLSLHPGFDPQGLTAVSLEMPPSQTLPADLDGLIARISSDARVESVAAVSAMPLSGLDTDCDIEIADRPGVGASIWYRMITRGYFSTLRIPVLTGREPESFQDGSTDLEVVINQEAARRLWPDGKALSARILLGGHQTEAVIVGVVKGVRHRNLYEAPRMEIYLPFRLWPVSEMTLALRSDRSPEQIETLLAATLGGGRDLAYSTPVAMTDRLDVSIAPARFLARLTGGFALTAVLLATLGVYAAVSGGVARRRREIGLRIALGAQPSHVVSLVLSKGLLPGVVGLLLGYSLSLPLGRALSDYLFETSAADPALALLMGAALTVAVLAACAGPTLQALRIAPLQTLREG